MNAIEIKGKVHKIEPIQTFNSFSKQNVIIVEDGQYPQYYPIEFSNEKIDTSQTLKEGQEISLLANLGGREWQGKYFLSLRFWKMSGNEIVNNQSNQQANNPNNDLPF